MARGRDYTDLYIFFSLNGLHNLSVSWTPGAHGADALTCRQVCLAYIASCSKAPGTRLVYLGKESDELSVCLNQDRKSVV